MVPEADEQVGAEAHPLPAQEEDGQVGGEGQKGHEEGEKVHEGEEAGERGILLHVTQGVDVDEKADSADQENHDGGEGVPEEGPGESKGAEAEPLPQEKGRGGAMGEDKEQGGEEGEPGGRAAQESGETAGELPSQEDEQERAQEGKEEGKKDHPFSSSNSSRALILSLR